MKKYISLFAVLFVLVIAVFFTAQIKSAYAAIIVWVQNDWSGGGGQSAWSDPTKFDTFTPGNYDLSNPGGETGIAPSIDADVVVGQPNMTSNSEYQGGVGAANNLSFAPDVKPINGKLFVVDGNRVLVFNAIPASNNASANFVIGRPNLTDVGYYAAAANTVGSPNAVTSDGTKLLIADTSNSRILVYNTIPTANNASANVVIGQPNMTSGTQNQGGTTAANTLSFPHSVHYDTTANKLFIADEYNHRILGYNSIPTVDDAPADFVLGQPDMTSNGTFPTSSSSLAFPYDVHSDGSKLFVADTANNRILIWNTIPSSSSVPADVVVGQTNMTNVFANDTDDFVNATLTGLNFPTCVFSDGTRLYICDTNNHRVLVYNSIPTTNHAAPDYIIGQGDAISKNNNRGGSANSNTLQFPYNLSVSGNQLFIADQNNYRSLIFNLNTHNSVLTSSVYNAGTSETWGPLRYTSNTPTNSALSFEVSTDGGTIWVPVTDYVTQTFGPSTTVAYRATFSSTDGLSMPLLKEVRIRNGVILPTVTTSATTSSTSTTETLNGEIIDDGGVVTERGFEYGKNGYDSTVLESSGPYGIGVFSLSVSNLSCGPYQFRAYAVNAAGKGYGDEKTFTHHVCGSATGRDGGGGGGGTTTPPTVTPPPPVVSSVAGCNPGDKFSTTNGLPCPSYVPSVLPTPLCAVVKILRIGMKGCDVLELHKKLAVLGYYKALIDDDFGRILLAAVKAFQGHNSPLKVDGIVGPKTRALLDSK